MLLNTSYNDHASFVLWLVITALASWRLAHALVLEHGPFGLCAMIRRMFGAQKMDVIIFKKSNVLSCVWCTAFWVGIVFTCAPGPILIPFALNAIAVWFNEVVVNMEKK